MKIWRCDCGLLINIDNVCPICSSKAVDILEERNTIKNRCASCRKKFKNTPQQHKMRGNYCIDCGGRINSKMKWIMLRNEVERIRDKYLEAKKINVGVKKTHKKLSFKELELNSLTRKIKDFWKVDMNVEYKDFEKFKDLMYASFLIKK